MPMQDPPQNNVKPAREITLLYSTLVKEEVKTRICCEKCG